MFSRFRFLFLENSSAAVIGGIVVSGKLETTAFKSSQIILQVSFWTVVAQLACEFVRTRQQFTRVITAVGSRSDPLFVASTASATFFR
jgi:hypothetical protein